MLPRASKAPATFAHLAAELVSDDCGVSARCRRCTRRVIGASRCDRDGDEPVDTGLARDGASEEAGEHGHDAQVPTELQSSDEIVDR